MKKKVLEQSRKKYYILLLRSLMSQPLIEKNKKTTFDKAKTTCIYDAIGCKNSDCTFQHPCAKLRQEIKTFKDQLEESRKREDSLREQNVNLMNQIEQLSKENPKQGKPKFNKPKNQGWVKPIESVGSVGSVGDEELSEKLPAERPKFNKSKNQGLIKPVSSVECEEPRKQNEKPRFNKPKNPGWGEPVSPVNNDNWNTK